MKKYICLFLAIAINVIDLRSQESLFTQLAGKIDLVVDKSGTGNYAKVQDAISAVTNNSSSRTVIFIKNGVYKEKIYVPSTKRNLTIIGENTDSTILTYDDYAAKVVDGSELGTFKSESFRVDADDFRAINVTFENSYGEGYQAVALFTSGDRQVFLHCRLIGWQDTYYTDSWQRNYLKDCYIEGAVDYIFGRTTVIFDSCRIHTARSGGYITAASTEQGYKFGYVFLNCTLTTPANVSGV